MVRVAPFFDSQCMCSVNGHCYWQNMDTSTMDQLERDALIRGPWHRRSTTSRLVVTTSGLNYNGICIWHVRSNNAVSLSNRSRSNWILARIQLVMLPKRTFSTHLKSVWSLATDVWRFLCWSSDLDHWSKVLTWAFLYIARHSPHQYPHVITIFSASIYIYSSLFTTNGSTTRKKRIKKATA